MTDNSVKWYGKATGGWGKAMFTGWHAAVETNFTTWPAECRPTGNMSPSQRQQLCDYRSPGVKGRWGWRNNNFSLKTYDPLLLCGQQEGDLWRETLWPPERAADKRMAWRANKSPYSRPAELLITSKHRWTRATQTCRYRSKLLPLTKMNPQQ